MRTLLVVFTLVAFIACKKDNNTTTVQRDYSGKWTLAQIHKMEYTLDNGDTVFTLNQRYIFTGTGFYMDFQLDNKGGGKILLFDDPEATAPTSFTYEAITPSYFHMDSTLCEITQLTDSSFYFNTISYDATTFPGKIQAKQDFFILLK